MQKRQIKDIEEKVLVFFILFNKTVKMNVRNFTFMLGDAGFFLLTGCFSLSLNNLCFFSFCSSFCFFLWHLFFGLNGGDHGSTSGKKCIYVSLEHSTQL